ncbi:sulfotransferase [Janthinobacterium sp. RB2R34]|uniref:sulfotransferase n=1 Tax=Janthinobacterium sp. RB2R34 TaxID=3424193 RepID=UPI003F240981
MKAHNGFAAQERQLTRGEQIAWQPGMNLRHWFPLTASAGPDGGETTLAWRDMAQIAFTDSFFENTLARQQRDERRVCHTPLAALAQFTQCNSVPAPNAFIFHVSRCGSTLLTQLLASLPQCIVMSEPPIIDSVLRLHHDQGAPDATVALLRQVMCAMGQRRTGQEKHFVIKFDCWHIHSLELLRAAFPDTPCLFLYREPQAVLASHQRQRGPQMVPGLIHPALLPLPTRQVAPGDLDGYTGVVLESFFTAAHPHAAAGELKLIHYSQLPGLLFCGLLDSLNIECTQQQRDAMQQRAQFHSKYTGNAYHGDPQAQQADRLAPVTAQIVSAYLALDRLRIES